MSEATVLSGILRALGSVAHALWLAQRGGFLRAVYAEGRTMQSLSTPGSALRPSRGCLSQGKEEDEGIVSLGQRVLGFQDLFWSKQEVFHFQS